MTVVRTGNEWSILDESWLGCGMTFGGKAQYARFWRTLLLRTEATCFGKKLSLPGDNAPEWTTWDGPSFIPSYACSPQRSLDSTHAHRGQNKRRGWGSLSVNWLIGLQLPDSDISVAYRVLRAMQHDRLLPGPNGIFRTSYIVAILTASRVQGV
jgi:hypothetical protein